MKSSNWKQIQFSIRKKILKTFFRKRVTVCFRTKTIWTLNEESFLYLEYFPFKCLKYKFSLSITAKIIKLKIQVNDLKSFYVYMIRTSNLFQNLYLGSNFSIIEISLKNDREGLQKIFLIVFFLSFYFLFFCMEIIWK